MNPSLNMHSVLACLTKQEILDALPKRTFTSVEKCSWAKMEGFPLSLPAEQLHALELAAQAKKKQKISRPDGGRTMSSSSQHRNCEGPPF
jgi:hypothetical protein